MTAHPGRSRVAGLAVGVVVLALLGYNLAQLGRGWDQLGPLSAGRLAPDFSLPSVGGPRLSLAAQRAPLVLLDFWAPWCEPCLRAMPALAALQRELGPRGLQILSINVEDDLEKSRAVARTLGGGIPVLLDDNHEVSHRYGVQVLPFVVLVGRDRRVVEVFAGPVREERLRRAVSAALGGR